MWYSYRCSFAFYNNLTCLNKNSCFIQKRKTGLAHSMPLYQNNSLLSLKLHRRLLLFLSIKKKIFYCFVQPSFNGSVWRYFDCVCKSSNIGDFSEVNFQKLNLKEIPLIIVINDNKSQRIAGANAWNPWCCLTPALLLKNYTKHQMK